MRLAVLESTAFRADSRAAAAAATLALRSRSPVVFADLETVTATEALTIDEVHIIDVSDHVKFGRFLDFHGLAKDMEGRRAVALRADMVEDRVINRLIEGWYRLAYWQDCSPIIVIVANDFSAPELASRMALRDQSLGHPRAASYARAMSRTLVATGVAEIMGGGIWVRLVNVLFRSPQRIRRRYLGR